VLTTTEPIIATDNEIRNKVRFPVADVAVEGVVIVTGREFMLNVQVK
jgi:hypothetical protein